MHPRTIVTADPELDDLNSMVRLLLYSNEMEIAGLIYASSRFHWSGDGSGTEFFLPGREYDTPQTSWRWAEGERFIDEVIDAYARAHPNLLVHDHRYPDAEALRSVVRVGNVEFEGDMSVDTPGSDLIVDVLLDDRTDPVYLQVWAGTSTIARALLSIEQRFGDTEQWAAVCAKVSSKAIITKFDSQDDTYESYIRPRWPRIRVIDVASTIWGYFARRNVLDQDAPLLGAEWLARNVTSRGPLGNLYRTWGDGRRMVADDPTDFFHLAGKSAEELTREGYRVWMEPQAKGEWISEGDTTNMLHLVCNGLRAHEHPSYGGWSGRAIRTSEGEDTWSVRGAVDTTDSGDAPPEFTVARWFGDAQRDFAARLRWAETSDFRGVNHPPILSIDPGDALTVTPGSTLTLHAVADDPDGDAVSLRWWQYREAGTMTSPLGLTITGSSVFVHVPDDAAVGSTAHLIAEARDDHAELPLVAYRRAILTVTAAPEGIAEGSAT